MYTDKKLLDEINGRENRIRKVLGNVAIAAAGLLTLTMLSIAGVKEVKAETLEPAGQFKLTFYCPCRRCSGKWGYRTSSGATCTEGRTVATDYFRAGTRLYIEGIGYRTVEDTGVHGRWIDVFVEDHDECNRLGVKHKEVYVVKD